MMPDIEAKMTETCTYIMYPEAAKAIRAVMEKKGDLKTILYREHNKKPNPVVYALCTKTLKYRQVLEEIIEKVPDVTKEYKSSHKSWHKGSMLLLLLYEFLFGNKKRITKTLEKGGTSRISKLILNNKNALNSALVRIKIKRQVANNEDLVDRIIYLYARVNTFKTTSNHVIYELIHQHQLLFMGTRNASDVDAEGQGGGGDIKVKAFWIDEHIPNLLGFTANCKVAGFPLCTEGLLLIQNKSSCLSAFVMDPDPSWFVLDACAAPGNKTSHLLCIMNSKLNKEFQSESAGYGPPEPLRVMALERDKKRCKVLKDRMRGFGMRESVEVQNMDFLGLSPSSEEGRQIKAILLDPTCSGSGLLRDRHGVHYEKDSTEKIESLSAEQKKLVKHAMNFENVQRIVYSTCSVNEEENEMVVEWALKQCDGQFVVRKVFPNWTQRGNPSYDFGDKVIRVGNDNSQNLQGFFVAMFERSTEDSSWRGHVEYEYGPPPPSSDTGDNIGGSANGKSHNNNNEQSHSDSIGTKKMNEKTTGSNDCGHSQQIDKSAPRRRKKRKIKISVNNAGYGAYGLSGNSFGGPPQKKRKIEHRVRRQRINAPKSKFGGRRR